MLKLKSVTLNGYGPFKKEVTYPLSDRGVVFVRGENRDDSGSGSNGSGKTTLLMSALWALRGESDPRPEGTSNRGLKSELVNDQSKNGSVSLLMEVDGKDVQVKRSMGTGGHKLKVFVDGHDRSCQDVALTQKVVDELVVDTSLLNRSIFLCQRDATGLLEMTDKGRKEILGKFVNLSVWVAAQEEASRLLALEKSRLSEIDGELLAYQSQLDSTGESIEKHRELSGRWDADRTSKIDALKKSLDEICSKFNMHAKNRELERAVEMERIDKEIAYLDVEEIERKVSLRESEVSEWSARLGSATQRAPSREQLDSAATALSAAEVQEARVAAIGMRAKGEADDYISKFKNGSSVCMECKQPVSEQHAKSHHEKMVAELVEMRASFSQARSQKVSAQQELERQQRRYDEKVASASAEMQNINVSLRSANEALGRAKGVLDSTRSKISVLREKKGILEESSSIEANPWTAEKAAAESRLNEALSTCENPHEQTVQTLSSNVNALEKTVESLRVERVKVEGMVSVYSSCKSLFGRQGVQSYVLETALSDLGERIDSYLNDLSAGHLSLGVSAVSEKKAGGFSEKMSFNPMVRKKDGSMVKRKYRQLSGGQQRRMSLAVALAFSDFACSRLGLLPNVLILDEVLQFLDGEGRKRVLNIINGLQRESVMLVSHDSELAGAFDVVDTVVLENDISSVEVG